MLSRRRFLTHLGAAAATIPLLPHWMREAKAQTVPAGGLIAIIFRNGGFEQDWQPYNWGSLVDTPSTAQPNHQIRQVAFPSERVGFNDVFHDGMPLLGTYRNDILQVSGLDSRSPASGHGPSALGAVADHQSVDQMAANVPNALSRVYGGCEPALRSLHMCNPGACAGASESFRLRGTLTRVPSAEDPRAIYNSLLAMGDPAVRARSSAAVGRSKIDIDRLKASARSASDRQQLDSYLQMMGDLETRLQNMCPLMGAIPEPTPLSYGYDELADWHTSLAVAAIAARATRVVTIYVQSGPGAGGSAYSAQAYHTDSHSEAPSVPQYLAYQRWMAQRYFLSTIDKLSQAGILQNSLVYFGGELSHGRIHNTQNMRVVLGGGANGMVHGGRVISYQRRQAGLEVPLVGGTYRGALMNQLFDTMLQSLGLQASDYALSGETGFGRARFNHPSDALYDSVRGYVGQPLPLI